MTGIDQLRNLRNLRGTCCEDVAMTNEVIASLTYELGSKPQLHVVETPSRLLCATASRIVPDVVVASWGFPLAASPWHGAREPLPQTPLMASSRQVHDKPVRSWSPSTGTISQDLIVSLVKLAARAFYDDVTTKGDNQPKTGRSDNRGMAVVVLDALTRRQWVREEDLAKDLKLHSKQLRRTLRYFEEEKLVTRDHRKETAKGARIFSAAVAATGDGQSSGKDGEEKLKLHTHSYCCLDYAQIYDVVRYRLHRMRKKLKDELENRNTVQEYVCPNCNRRYTAFDALQLISPDDESFRCESCRAELVAESDKRAAEEMGDNDDNARRRRREKLKDMLQKMEVQLKPLSDLLNRVKDLPVPEFGSLQAWEARANAAGRAANGDSSANDSSRSSQGQGYGGTPMPFLGETKSRVSEFSCGVILPSSIMLQKLPLCSAIMIGGFNVEVALSGVPVKEEDSKPDVSATTMKVLPPWMIKQGMNLTMEQRGEVKQELRPESSSPANQLDDKKSKVNDKDDEKSIQASEKKHLCDEYLKAYYAALLQRQQDQEEAAKRNQQELDNISSEMPRQVGMKSKREDDDRDDGVEWEEAPTGSLGLSLVSPTGCFPKEVDSLVIVA
ncbi:hypothetical protein Sjap_024329 [Stephania japonica]|uniref:HTH TFE/IIEalpha-type domain-containing protein n=1 Tax=Stephania japonica TaxID=461633 RepID=A0AAP0HNL7_9MAGN